MAVTGSIVGRESQHIRIQGATWNTEVTSGTFTKMRLLEDGLGVTQEHDDVEEADSTWIKESDLGIHSATFAPRERLRFDDIHMLAMVMGDGNYATVEEVNTGKEDYKHIILPAEDNYGDFLHIGIKKGSEIHSIYSVKYTGFTISGSASPNRVEVSYNTLVSQFDNASSVITASDFSGADAAPTGFGGAVFFRNMSFRINNQSAAALATADELSNIISSFEFSFQRSLTEDRTNDSGLYLEEPVEDGYPEATLRLELRNFGSDTDTYLTRLLAGTKKKFSLNINGNAASSATGTVAMAKLQIWAPNAILSEVEPGPYSGPGRIPSSVTFKLRGAETTSDAAAMNWVEPFRLYVINTQSAKAVS